MKSRRETLIPQRLLISSLARSYSTLRQSLSVTRKSASQAKGDESRDDSDSNDTNVCQLCELYGEKTKAEVVCISGCKLDHHCMDCWEHAHKRPKLRNHKYKRVSDPFKFERKQTALNLVRNEKISTLPKSTLPWKTLAPGLFQLFKVVLADTDEKVVVVEEELAGLCNTFTPNCCTLDCSEIDFNSLKALSVTPIGLVGDNRAIHGFLQNHLKLKDVDYNTMVDPDVCPAGLYALMPNKSTLVVFYWRLGRHTENNRITCQMLRHVRDLCHEVVVCIEEKILSNLKFPRPQKRDHLLMYKHVTIDNEVIKHQARASNGFDAAFEATSEKVVLSNNELNVYLCTPSLHRSSFKQSSMKDRYKVFRLEVTNDEKVAADADPNHTFRPLFKFLRGAEMSLQIDDLEVKALFSSSYEDNMILVACSRPSGIGKNRADGDSDMVVYVDNWRNLTDNVFKRFVKKHISLLAFDAKTRLLALCYNDRKQIAIFEFTEYFTNLKHYSDISLNDISIQEVLHMQFIQGKKEILLVGSNSKGYIYSIKYHVFTAGVLNLEVEEESLADVISYDDFVITVTKEAASDKKEGVKTESCRCNFSVRAYSSETRDLLCKEKLYTFVNVSQKSKFRLVELSSQLHLVCIDVTSGKCQSARLSLISPGTNIVTMQASSRENDDLKDNEILENFLTIFRKYPITNSYAKETKPLRVAFAIPNQPNPYAFRKSFQDNVESYFHSMFRALQAETGKQVDQLEKGMRLQTCFTDDMSAVFSYPYEPVKVSDFVLAVSTAVPIQIARPENNRLIPLTKGGNVVLAGSLSSTDDVKAAFSFGVYEAVLRYAKAPAKVISATGMKRVGKSFLLNHMTGSLFDVAGGRGTQGVWMAIKLYPDVTVIALDFEGFGSSERSTIEDVLMVLFGAAVSSLTVLKMAPRFDKNTRRLFDFIQESANRFTLTQSDTKQLFNGKLAILCKDVPFGDSTAIRYEIKAKIEEMLKNTSHNNFGTKLYSEKLRVLTSETFGKEDMFASFDMIKEYLHEQEEGLSATEKSLKVTDNPEDTGCQRQRQRQRILSASSIAHVMKTALAKIYLLDWKSFENAELEEIHA